MSGCTILPQIFVEKLWGREELPSPFTSQPGKRIGEIWFEPPAEFDHLLAKYLFTSDKLSVQVHPNDAQAPGGKRGKEECWLVISAEPEAKLAIGLKREVDRHTLEAAALDGSIEDLLQWHDAKVGDFFYLPAGTIHAIGPGLGLIEIQQNSDVTYRLYDYGRPRELHLEQAIDVAIRDRYALWHKRSTKFQRGTSLVDGPPFNLDMLAGPADERVLSRYDARSLIMPLNGEVLVGGVATSSGQCVVAESLQTVSVPNGITCLVAR